MQQNELKTASVESGAFPAQPFKDKTFTLDFFNTMIRARVMEERLIKMVRTGDGYFWIGGPGEEAFNVALGKLVNKGFGLKHDFMHLHYRSNAVLLSMGQPMLDFIRQMNSKATDPFSGGRNFVSHICKKEWNVLPVTSTIETQYSVAPGTAMAQTRAYKKGKDAGITVVVGGDAGSAEGDFASSMIWASRPGNELPLLSIVTNNGWGISTSSETQHGEKNISDRAKAFGFKTAIVDGSHAEKAWQALSEAMRYVRETRKPFMLEVMVSRLNGHSSSSGANRVSGESCPIALMEKKILKQKWLEADDIKQLWKAAEVESLAALKQAKSEDKPLASTVLDHSFVDITGGVPGRDF